MKLTISVKCARAATLAAVAARAFVALAVDAPAPHNGAWLSALLGGLLAAPWVLCVERMRRTGANAARARLPLTIAMLAVTLPDAAWILSCAARSAGYLSLDRAPALALALPFCLAALWCVHKNGDALGYGAMIWLRVFPAMLLLVTLMQARHYRPSWLLPVLGEGWRAVVIGAIRTAGCIVPASALMQADSEDKGGGRSVLWTLAGAVAVAAVMLFLRLMMTPTLTRGGDDWLMRLDTLLTNGRAPLYLQLPMIAIWFAGLLHLFCAEIFAVAGLAQRLVPSQDGRLCGIAAIAAVAVLFILAPLDATSDAAARWGFIAIAGLTGLTALAVGRKGGAL